MTVKENCETNLKVHCVMQLSLLSYKVFRWHPLNTVQLNINLTHVCREHVCVCTLMACNFVNYREYFNFACFGSVRSCATVHDNTLEYTLHE